MGKKVMVVDDHASLGDTLGQLLKVLGHQPVIFTSASECLAWLEAESPDLALVDIRMPGLDGVALFEQIRTRGHQFPVVVVTGYPGDELAKEAAELGVLAVVGKPVSMDMLQRIVELEHG